jgi:hypothetical protein
METYSEKLEAIVKELQSFHPNLWPSPHSRYGNYGFPPEGCGLYVILAYKDVVSGDFEIAYIGSSTNLRKRYHTHEIVRLINKDFPGGARLCYKEMDVDYLRQLEVDLIKLFKPRYNVQHTRG